MDADAEQTQRRAPRRTRNRSKLLGEQPIDSVAFHAWTHGPRKLGQVVDLSTITSQFSSGHLRLPKSSSVGVQATRGGPGEAFSQQSLIFRAYLRGDRALAPSLASKDVIVKDGRFTARFCR